MALKLKRRRELSTLRTEESRARWRLTIISVCCVLVILTALIVGLYFSKNLLPCLSAFCFISYLYFSLLYLMLYDNLFLTLTAKCKAALQITKVLCLQPLGQWIASFLLLWLNEVHFNSEGMWWQGWLLRWWGRDRMYIQIVDQWHVSRWLCIHTLLKIRFCCCSECLEQPFWDPQRTFQSWFLK